MSEFGGMSNTYSQLHVHLVTAVKFREALIAPTWRDELSKYVTGIVTNLDQKMISVFCMPDHMHLLIGYRPSEKISDLMRVIKSESSEWINKRGLASSLFRWQGGYGAFAVSKSHIPRVADYIKYQEVHHRKVTMVDEFKHLLIESEIPYDERYIFHMPV